MYYFFTIACGDCVDKLVMLNDESAQQANMLADRLDMLDDLSMIYQHLAGIISQAQSLMVRLAHNILSVLIIQTII